MSDIKKEKTKNIDKNSNDFKVLFKWKIKKDPKINRSLQVVIIIFLVAIMIILFRQKNYFGLAAVFMIIFLIIMLQGNKEEVNYAILKRGIKINKEVFPWKNLESFWIFESFSEVYIKTKKAFIQNISLSIKEKDTKRIRDNLLEFLPEKEMDISLIEIIFKKLGF